MIRSFVLLTGLLIGLTANGWAEDTVVGQIKNINGSAYVLQGSTKTPAQLGLNIHRQDVLVTGPDGALGIILKDNTIRSLYFLSNTNSSRLFNKQIGFRFDAGTGRHRR